MVVPAQAETQDVVKNKLDRRFRGGDISTSFGSPQRKQ
jgi:hypothetical protein